MRYLYVMALDYNVDGSMGSGHTGPYVGFVHTFVDAVDDTDAYDKGFAALKPTTDISMRMNDYVVPLEA